jgi:DNA topoisomerase-3
MKKFVISLAKQKDIKPPRGYTKSAAICRSFLDQHAPRKGGGETTAPVSAEHANEVAKPVKRHRKATSKQKKAGQAMPEAATPKKKKLQKQGADTAPSLPPASRHAEGETALRIPYGNKDVARQLGARYRSGGWYAPPGTDLAAFEERGWL